MPVRGGRASTAAQRYCDTVVQIAISRCLLRIASSACPEKSNSIGDLEYYSQTETDAARGIEDLRVRYLSLPGLPRSAATVPVGTGSDT